MSGDHAFRHWLKSVGLFFKAAGDFRERSTRFLKKEAHDAEDNFMLLCFGDMLGFPMQTSYYTIELLPYFVETMDGWEKRMLQRQWTWEEKWAQYDLYDV